ncbi:MAG: AAA family ATPase [Saprospiraceae bacterium]|nr:AAA family ATPase [Saprospiraceae bacterium]
MPYIRSISIDTEKSNPFPFNVPGVKFAKNISLDNSINFIVGDNGTGKSTLIEAIAFRLQLPHMDGSAYPKRSFQGAISLSPFLQIDYKIERPVGFFFRAEDFGDYMNSVHRRDISIHEQLKSLEGEVPDQVIGEMVDNANYQIHHMRKNYGEELSSFSHGEAYLKIIQEKISKRGIYILDEPEAALSPTKQLSLIYQIKEHLKTNMSQFIIATHSPILMAIPSSNLYEITEDEMVQKSYVDTEHYMVTKGFLNNPDLYLNYL